VRIGLSGREAGTLIYVRTPAWLAASRQAFCAAVSSSGKGPRGGGKAISTWIARISARIGAEMGRRPVRRSDSGAGVSHFLCGRRFQSRAGVGSVTVSGGWPTRQAGMCCRSMFPGSIKAPVAASRPTSPPASHAGPVKFAACGGTGPAWGEHGEDPQFDQAEHGFVPAIRARTAEGGWPGHAP
jgi:hypothetical protein